MNTVAIRKTLSGQWARLQPFSRRARLELPAHFGRVREASGATDEAMREVETRFLEIGNTLETTTDLARDLVEHCEALIALALGQGGGEIMIDEAARHIWSAIDFVEKGDERIELLIRQLIASNDEITQTLGTEQLLERTITPLNYVQTLFRVESAGLPPPVQEMFHALVREINRIRQHVEGGFREKFELIRQIQSILTSAITQLVNQQSRAKQTVTDLRKQMAASLESMKASYERNRDRDTRLIDVSRAVSAETGKVVIALQVQDMLNQKLQQVHSALSAMEESFGQLSFRRAEAGRSLRFIQETGKVAGAQLTAMQEELATAGETIGGGLQQIIGRMDTLDGDCLALRDLDSVTTGVDGAVQILLDSLEDVRRLVGTAGSHAKEAHRTIEPIGGMTTNFTSFMRELSLEIQLIGLNAEVQATHVGRGTGLEVLSARTSEISRETSRLSEALASQLDSLTAGLDRVVQSFREIRDETATFNTKLDGEINGDEKCLHDYRDSALKVLTHVGERLPQLKQATETARSQSDFAATAVARITELQSTVAALSAAAQALADGAGISADTTGLTDRFIAGYTMRSQVEIHREAVGAAPGAEAKADNDAGIELFDQAPLPQGSPAPAMGSIELFDDAPAPAVPSPSPAAAIELWDDAPGQPSAPPATPPAPEPGDKRAAA